MAWIADGLEKRMVISFVGERMRLLRARWAADTSDPRSASKAVADTPRVREECSISVWLEKATAMEVAGIWLSSILGRRW